MATPFILTTPGCWETNTHPHPHSHPDTHTDLFYETKITMRIVDKTKYSAEQEKRRTVTLIKRCARIITVAFDDDMLRLL